MTIFFYTSGNLDYLKPETCDRRYFVIGETQLNHLNTAAAPNTLQLLLEDDELAANCQGVAHYRAELAKRLLQQFTGAPAAGGGAHTPGLISAPITPAGRAFGLIPVGKGWADDLINWSTREFRNPADARRLMASWNACVHATTADLEHFAMTRAPVEAVEFLANCTAVCLDIKEQANG
jgi:hypothetical protein